MLHVRTSQLIIAGDGCGIQVDFFPGAWQWKTSLFSECTVIGQARFHFIMKYIRTKINVLYKYKCSYTFLLCTIDSSQQILFFYFFIEP